ncbi:MAG TPA: hypothetical protein VFD58_37060 [Blastocatellia bacterium]|nr:hypothetical protein [Blastocatellia bacterium]
MNIRNLAVGTLFFLALAGFGGLAQDSHREHHKAQTGGDVIVGQKGTVHFTEKVKVGDTILNPGMYQVQHVAEGGDHVIIFKEVGMAAGYKMGNTPVGKEVARVRCNVEPVAKAATNTKVTLRKNAAGEKEVAEVQVAGEAFKHLF